ncbi:CDKN2AIP N-terminal-like protein [Stigmatopora nigra]
MSADDVNQFIKTNRRVAKQVETFRGHSESDKHWAARREFLLRNMSEFEGEGQMDRLLSLSIVWTNNKFLGCQYSAELMERVNEMADGIEVEDAPVFKTRDEMVKQQRMSFGIA